MGDFNCELIDWTRCSAPLNSLQASFLYCDTSLEFVQHISTPTRGTNILDIILSNNPQLISHIKFSENCSYSWDHLSIGFTIITDAQFSLYKGVIGKTPTITIVPDWLKADWSSIFNIYKPISTGLQHFPPVPRPMTTTASLLIS